MNTTTHTKLSRWLMSILAFSIIGASNVMARQLTEYTFEAYDSLTEARISAISQKKHLFVLSGAPWCTYCNQAKTYIAGLGKTFTDQFVVYYADVSIGAEMAGRLPQYGSFDPRTICTTYGWSASSNSYKDSSGYSTSAIDSCIKAAEGRTIGSVTAIDLEGMEAVFPGTTVTVDAKATFDDNVVMLVPASAIKWSATGAGASISTDGKLTIPNSATENATIKITATFPEGIAVNNNRVVEKTLTVVSTDSVSSISIDLDEVNLADSTAVRFKCLANFANGKQGEISADSWGVTFVENCPLPSGTPLSPTNNPDPEIDDMGNLTYKSQSYYGPNGLVNPPGYSIGDHELDVTANWNGETVTQRVLVYGPSRAWPSKLELRTPAGEIAPGEVIQLYCGEVSYTYKGKVKTTDNTELFDFWVMAKAEVGNSEVPLASGSDGLWQRFGKIGISVPSETVIRGENTVSIQLNCRMKDSAYTMTDGNSTLMTEVFQGKLKISTYKDATNAQLAAINAASAKYPGINQMWLNKYFPDAEITENFFDLDSDKDGYSNGAEFVLSTDPTNANSKFKYTAVHFDAHEVVYWLMWDELPGRTWTLQGKRDLLGDRWVDIDRETISLEEAQTYHAFRVEVNGTVHTPRKTDFGTWVAPDWYSYDEATNTVTLQHDNGTATYQPQLVVPEIEARRHLYTACNEGQRQVYDLYAWAWENKDLQYGAAITYFLPRPITPTEFQEAYNAFNNDYTEAWNVVLATSSENYTIGGESYVVAARISIQMYDYPEKAAAFEEAMKDWRGYYAAAAQNATTEEARMKVVFDLAKDYYHGGAHIRYDYSYGNGFATGTAPAHTAYGGVVKKTVVCEGFAKTFAFLCHALGASDNVATLCGKVGSTTSSHVWNAVRLNGKWYEVDATAGEWTDAFQNSAYISHTATGVSAIWLKRAQSGEYDSGVEGGGTPVPDPDEPDPDEPDTPTPTYYTVQVGSGGNGTVSGGGTYEAGSSVTVTATPNAGYVFTKWTGTLTSTNASFTFEVTGDVSLTATFAKEETPEPEVPVNPDSDFTGTFYAVGVDPDDAYDLDKPVGADGNLCWAYAFSCMVDWYQDMYLSIGATLGAKEPQGGENILAALKKLTSNVSGSFPTAVDKYIQSGGYMISYITLSDWNMLMPKAYKAYDYSTYKTELGTLASFSKLLLENLYKGPAFVDLLKVGYSGGHAVVIWGAEFENGIVKSVYISDSDDGMYQYTKYPVSLVNGRINFYESWAPTVNAVTFLYAPNGVTLTPPQNETDPDADVEVPDGTLDDIRSAAIEAVRKRHPDGKLTSIKNPGVPRVIPDADVKLVDGVATFSYEFGVSDLTVTAGKVVAKAKLGKDSQGKDLSFADGVTLSLVDLNGNVISNTPTVDAKTVDENGAHVFTFDLPQNTSTFIFKVRATK